MSGEFVTVDQAKIITDRVAPGPSDLFYVDLANLQSYIAETSADQIYIQQGINDNGSNTLVITCYAKGQAVYHSDGDGVKYVLEHISLPPAND